MCKHFKSVSEYKRFYPCAGVLEIAFAFPKCGEKRVKEILKEMENT